MKTHRTHLKQAERATGARGFVTITVVLYLAIASAALLGMAELFAHEFSRTRGVQDEAQLRQLLLAGVPLAQAELKTGGGTPREVSVAIPVEGAKMTLRVLPPQEANVPAVSGPAAVLVTPPGSGVQVRLEATYRRSKASQIVTLDREGRLLGAELKYSGGL